MQLLNHEPIIKTFGNGFQITFPNQYTVIVKNGIGAKCTQSHLAQTEPELLMASRFGGNSGPDVEAEIYNPAKVNITDKFGERDSLGFISTLELVNLLYIVSNLS